MKEYIDEITLSAQKGINDYVHFIKDEYKSPMTSEKHLIGLFEEIQSLKNYAESIQVSTKARVLKYGTNARIVKYKNVYYLYSSQYYSNST